jgi:uncharacterized protein DUF6152
MNRLLGFAVIVLLSCVVPLVAHHGTPVSYDNSKLITSKATVTGFVFKNPHVALFFDTTDEHNNVRHWSGEMANPATFIRVGWNKKRSEDALKAGTQITISYYLSLLDEHLPPDVGAALVVRIRDSNNQPVLLDRN